MVGIGAPKDNQYAKKLTTPELRKMAYDSYCAHFADGQSRDTWFFEHPDLDLTAKTMDKYIRESPSEFPPSQLEKAFAKGQLIWEKVVQESANGKNRKANTASLQMWMRNRFKWDRPDLRPEYVNETAAQAQDKLMNQLASQQKVAQEAASSE